MSPGCIGVPDTMLARDVATLMHSKGIKRVPVLRDGKLVGIVARSDLIRALAQILGEKVPAPAAAEFETIDEALRHGREELEIQPRGAMRKSEAAPQATSRT